jgi:hypothetical protein
LLARAALQPEALAVLRHELADYLELDDSAVIGASTRARDADHEARAAPVWDVAGLMQGFVRPIPTAAPVTPAAVRQAIRKALRAVYSELTAEMDRARARIAEAEDTGNHAAYLVAQGGHDGLDRACVAVFDVARRV